MAVSGTAGRLDPGQIAQIRRWAARVGPSGKDDRLTVAARAILRLADEAERLRAEGRDGPWAWSEAPGTEADLPPTAEQIARARRWALGLAEDGAAGELKAAAKAILLLCDDIASLRGEPVVDEAAPVSGEARRRRPPLPRRPLAVALAEWRRVHPLAVLAALIPAAVIVLFLVVARAAAPDLDPKGPSAGALVGAAGLARLEFSIAGGAARLEQARWTLDGQELSGRARLVGDRIVVRPPKLVDGDHDLEVSLGGLAPWSAGGTGWSFTVDTAPPQIQVTRASLQAQLQTPYELAGAASSAVSLAVDGKPVRLEHGRFAVRYDGPPAAPIQLVARDSAGNTARSSVTVALAPRRPAQPLRAVHVSADGWANDQLRAGVLALVDQKKINAVELDLKDESGVVGWDAPVPLARRIGAARDVYDLKAAVELLHRKGVRVIGRLVAFRDPILAQWAWTANRRSMVIQTPDGGAYSGGYGGFTNFADEAVRRYNIDIATAAAKLGVDDILYDYVRRPDGPLASMVFPGFRGDPAASIASFLGDTRTQLRRYGTFLGASVFGIAVTRPDEIAQNVPLIVREVDYIAPMVYPSHWGPDEYGIPNADVQPYDIVFRALQDYQKAVRGTGARVVPWLQDFSLRAQYGPAEVRAQIKAANDAGVDEFLLWDPAVTYTADALRPSARFPTTGTAKAAAGTGTLVTLPSVGAAAEAPVDTGLAPNELGLVPVLMYHQLLPDGGSEYDLTPEEFRAELERLYDDGYRPVTAADYVSGRMDVPKGTTPVVLTFDDGSTSQAALLPNGEIDPGTAVGILVDFAATHPGFRPVATFYLNGDPFRAGDRAAELLGWLSAHGFELGNHTRDHANLGQLSGAEVERQFVLEDRIIHGYVPGAKVTTMALPFGVLPADRKLVRRGTWDGGSYAFRGVMLVGAEPAPSPFSRAFRPSAIPRIRSFPADTLENGSADWLNRLEQDPQARYVSDGDPQAITFPADLAGTLARRYAAKAKQY